MFRKTEHLLTSPDNDQDSRVSINDILHFNFNFNSASCSSTHYKSTYNNLRAWIKDHFIFISDSIPIVQYSNGQAVKYSNSIWILDRLASNLFGPFKYSTSWEFRSPLNLFITICLRSVPWHNHVSPMEGYQPLDKFGINLHLRSRNLKKKDLF